MHIYSFIVTSIHAPEYASNVILIAVDRENLPYNGKMQKADGMMPSATISLKFFIRSRVSSKANCG